jgi:hypothetical protein
MDISKHLPSLRYLGTALGKVTGVIRVGPFKAAFLEKLTLKAVKPSSGPSGEGRTAKGYNPTP